MSVAVANISWLKTSNNEGQFVAKVTRTKTRTKDGKDYFVHRITIPNQMVEGLGLKNNDHLFVKSSARAKWYHLFDWNAQPQAWNMLPIKLQQEIQSSGMNISVPARSPELKVEEGGITSRQFELGEPQYLTQSVSEYDVTNMSGSTWTRVLTNTQRG